MLQKAFLRQTLSDLFVPASMPSTEEAVARWLSGYRAYAQAATAGVCALAAPLVADALPGPFFESLDNSLRKMWMSAPWVGPGVTAVTAVVPDVRSYLDPLRERLLSSYDSDLPLSIIAEALHTYTLSVTVSVTPPTGTPAIVTLL